MNLKGDGWLWCNGFFREMSVGEESKSVNVLSL